MRGNGTPRGRAELVAARVQALLAIESPDPPDVANGRDPADAPGGIAAAHARRAPTGPTLWDRVSSRVPVRLDPGHRGALAVGVAVIVAALLTGAWLVSSRPQAVPVTDAAPSVPGVGPLVGTDGVTEGPTGPATSSSWGASPSSGAASSPTGAASATTGELVVDVAGKVRHPGVYRLPPGSRVDDAVQAAGGVRGHVNLSRLNLAAVLVDGQQVAVGVPAAVSGAVPAAGAAGAGGAAPAVSTATVVDLNTATLEQLESLPGVGPVLGQDILDYRQAHGSFTTIDQLKDVSGIGDVTFGDLKSLVSV